MLVDVILCAKRMRASVDSATAHQLDQSLARGQRLLEEVNEINTEAAGFLNSKGIPCQDSIN